MLPCLDGSVRRLDERGEGSVGRARAAEISEVRLVEQHGVRCDELLALEGSHLVRHRVLWESAYLLLDKVQTFHGAAIVVLMVRRDELFGESLQLRRIEWKRLDLMVAAVRT